MVKTTKTGISEVQRQKAIRAEEISANWLAKGNTYHERGNDEKAAECYEKSAQWLMRANELRRW